VLQVAKSIEACDLAGNPDDYSFHFNRKNHLFGTDFYGFNRNP
jgi:hypothetical protein